MNIRPKLRKGTRVQVDMMARGSAVITERLSFNSYGDGVYRIRYEGSGTDEVQQGMDLIPL